MNICFIEGDMSRKGGTEKMTALIANRLCEENTVSIVSLAFNGNEVFFELDSRVQHIVATKSEGKLSIVKQIYFLHNYIKDNSIDWVINVDVGSAMFGVSAAFFTNARVITWEHGNFYNNWNSKFFPYIRKYATKYSNAFVVLTERDKKNYIDNLKIKKPIYVVPNPIEKNDYKYSVESKTIISAGHLIPLKGYDFAIKSAANLFEKHTDWKWVIFGEGPEREKLEKMVRDNGLENNVFLPGATENLSDEYKKSAIYVMTSEMEGLPMVLLEAKSYGLPLVSFDIMTGPSDIIRDGVNGYLVSYGDVEELTEKIAKLIDSDELRMNFSSNASLDMEKFDFNEIMNKWNMILEK